jgi:type IV pilus assembly protein PilY1
MKNLITGLLTFWTCLAIQADDIDIYQGKSTGTPQNVMFSMDTSRSMSRWVYFDLGPYNPATTYPKPINGYDPETYYYSKFLDGDASSTIETGFIIDHSLDKDAIVCPGAIDTIEEYGEIVGKFKRWDTIDYSWDAPGLINSGLPMASMDTDAIWECKYDANIHPTYQHIRYEGTSRNNQYRTPPQTCIGSSCWTPGWYVIAYEAVWIDHIRRIFKGNYLNWQIFAKDGSLSGPNQDRMSRMTLARAAAKHAANTVQGFNLGMARFDVDSNGGFIDLPLGPVSSNKTLFNEKIDDYFTYGGTPLSETYFEIARYYRGDNVYFGNNTKSRTQNDTVHRLSSGMVDWYSGQANSDLVNTPSVGGSRRGPNSDTYQSPISSSCQSESLIVLFTDGEPSNDTGANAAIRAMVKDVNFPAGLGTDCSGDGGCADELAYYLANYDQSDKQGRQTIRTSVIGGFLTDTSAENIPADDAGSNNDLDGIPLLRSIANHGKGKYYGVSTYDDVVVALVNAFAGAADTPATFVAPALSINSYNSLEHQDELYYAMFSPAGAADWSGNLKLYRLNRDGIVVDANDNPLIAGDGIIDSAARSFWTPADSPDGPDVLAGGAAQHLTHENNIYTHLVSAEGPLKTVITDTPAMRSLMGLAGNVSDDEVSQIVNWANRVIPTADPAVKDTRRKMEDPIHSRPVVINYASNTDATGSIIDNSVVYVATNAGYLHAFKADKVNFHEYFSYIPKELLPNIASYALNEPLRKDQLYGLDGYINYWIKDVNKNNIVDNTEDKVILYVGMRRGGRNYYALDITKPDSPKYLWQIDGGSTNFERLGQTWSEPTVAKVPWNGGEKVVLIFGGGYDDSEDGASTASSTQLGNSIFMVDAEFGTLLWSASKTGHDYNNSDMTASIVSNIRNIDTKGDRLMNLFYVTDVAGRVWRFDINPKNTGSADFAEGGIIFDANGDSGDSTYNRIYSSPSISYFKDQDDRGFLSLAIGTGHRAEPLKRSSGDEFYILKDYNVTSKPSTYVATKPSDLEAGALTTANVVQGIFHTTLPGWKFTLSLDSEKVLADALTTHGKFIFTSFAPSADAHPGACNADIGITTAYTLYFRSEEAHDQLACFESGICSDPPPEPPEIPKDPGNEPPPLVPAITVEQGCDKPDPADCGCEDSGTTVLIGTSKLGETINSCGTLKKDYWMER